MSEIIRTRDCIVHYKGDTFPVVVSDDLISLGWLGGQGVEWAESSRDEFKVTFSTGHYGGFLLLGSDEVTDALKGLSKNQLQYGYATLCLGSWLVSVRNYERYTYSSRVSGPLVPIQYTEGQKLRFSLRGLFTVEDEWDLSGDLRAPNGFYVANIVQAPSTLNNQYLVLQTIM